MVALRILFFLVIFFGSRYANAEISFQPGHFYVSTGSGRDYDEILQYDTRGVLVASMPLGKEVRGLAFGPDNLLYATINPRFGIPEVWAIDDSGEVVGTYTYLPGYHKGPPLGLLAPSLGGNGWYGRLHITEDHIYMAGGDALSRFTIGEPGSGRVIYEENQVRDILPLPNNRLLLVSKYALQEITDTGFFWDDIEIDGLRFEALQSVAYDPESSTLYLSRSGGNQNNVIKIDYTTKEIVDSVQLSQAGELFLNERQELIVGSWNSPQIFSNELESLFNFGIRSGPFITQYRLPEPSACVLVGWCVMLLAGFVRWRPA